MAEVRTLFGLQGIQIYIQLIPPHLWPKQNSVTGQSKRLRHGFWLQALKGQVASHTLRSAIEVGPTKKSPWAQPTPLLYMLMNVLYDPRTLWKKKWNTSQGALSVGGVTEVCVQIEAIGIGAFSGHMVFLISQH